MKIIKVKAISDNAIFINPNTITFISSETIEGAECTIIHLQDNAEIYTKQPVKEIVELIRKGE